MTTKKWRVCRICGKEFEGHNGACSRCNQRLNREKYVGRDGCPQCGGRVSRKRGICRRCFWTAYAKTVKVIKERRAVGEYSAEGIPAGY